MNMRRSPRKESRTGLWRYLCKILRMRNAMPCVGLIVLAGCLTFIVAPDEGPSVESQVAAQLHPSFVTVVLSAPAPFR